MICKWCGGNLIPSDLKCKRCGREIPALSDCGGFYDLIPEAKKGAERSIDSNIHVPEADYTNQQQKLTNDMQFEKNKKKGKKRFVSLPMLTFVCVAFVAIITCKTYGKINRYSDEIKVLRKSMKEIASDISAIEIQMEPLEESSSNEITVPIAEPITEHVPKKISEQDVNFLVEILKQQDIKEYRTIYDLGECGNAVSVSYIFDKKSDNEVSTLYYIDGTGGVEFDFKMERENDTRTVSVTYKIAEEIFDIPSVPETCEWQYRIGSKGIWESIPKDIFNQTDTLGQTRLSVMESNWQGVIDNSEETFELRCRIYRTNREGGSVTLLIEGISFYQETNDEILKND